MSDAEEEEEQGYVYSDESEDEAGAKSTPEEVRRGRAESIASNRSDHQNSSNNQNKAAQRLTDGTRSSVFSFLLRER